MADDNIITFETPTNVKFEEQSFNGTEPQTDRLLVLETGERLRERVTELPTEDGMGGRAFVITTSQLDADNNVSLDSTGRPILSQHEIRFTAAALANLGTIDKMQSSFELTRQEAVAKATKEIEAQKVLDSMFSGRL